jgi:hypothetical protein
MLISSFWLILFPLYLIMLIVWLENFVSSYGVLWMDVCSKNVNLFCQEINKWFSPVLSLFLNSNICPLPSLCHNFPWKVDAIINRS